MRLKITYFNSLFLLTIIGSLFLDMNIIFSKKVGLLLNNKKHSNQNKTEFSIKENKLTNFRNDKIKNNFNKEDLQKESTSFRNFPIVDSLNKETGNHTIVSFYDNEYEIFNRITKQYTYYNISSPFDEYQIVKNIECNMNNCMYPNVCLNNNMCGCDNHFANTKSQNNNKIKFCDYFRKSPIITSVLELIIPGAGFLYSGCIKYGLLKLFFGFLVMILLVIEICKVFRDKNDNLDESTLNASLEGEFNPSFKQSLKDTRIKEKNVINAIHKKIKFKRDSENNSFKQNLNQYLLIISSLTLLIWLFIDYVMIGMRIKKDGNGVGFTIYANYGNSN